MICFFNLLFVTLLLGFSNADPLGEFCNKNTNITNKKTKISSNIETLLTQLVSKTTSTGYTATTYGSNPNKVYGLAQCRGDITNPDCSNCIQDAANQIKQRCPNQTDSRIWYDYCFLRYDKVAFATKVDTSFGIFYYNVENVTEPKIFNRELGNLMDKIRSEAVLIKNKGLGKGETKLSTFTTIYGLVQCTRDLAPIDCAQCLAISVGNFPIFCGDKKGCRVLYSSCYVRYELYPFFFPLDSNKTEVYNENIKTMVYP